MYPFPLATGDHRFLQLRPTPLVRVNCLGQPLGQLTGPIGWQRHATSSHSSDAYGSLQAFAQLMDTQACLVIHRIVRAFLLDTIS